MADASDSPSNLLENELQKIREASGDSISPDEADMLEELGHALYENDPYPVYKHNGERKTYSATSVRNYLLRLRVDVYGNGHSLTELSPDEFNRLMRDLDDDRSRSTTTQAQSGAKAFYRYFDELDTDPEDIEVFKTDTSQRKVDPRTLLRPEEVEALRQEVDNTVNPRRNRALLEMMIYTGQRIRALQTLRCGDVDVDSRPGAIYLNDDAEGLKDASKRGRYRPLTAALKYVREWVNHHPKRDHTTGELPDDAWLFVGQPNHDRTDLDRPWHTSSMRQMLKRAAERAEIDPDRVTPHAFRHYWYTHMDQDENVDSEKLKAAGGWSKNSNTPAQIYQNFDDEELMKGIEEELGFREEEEGSVFIPDLCPDCNEPLEPHWNECPVCDYRLRDDTVREAEEAAQKGKYESEDEEMAGLSEAIQRAIMDRPDLMEEIASELEAENE